MCATTSKRRECEIDKGWDLQNSEDLYNKDIQFSLKCFHISNTEEKHSSLPVRLLSLL